MSFSWFKVGPAHYTTDDDEWSISRDAEHFECYRIRHRGQDQGGSRTLRSAMLKAGKMFATINEAKKAADIGAIRTVEQRDETATEAERRVNERYAQC